MAIIIPPDAPVSVQNALRELDRRLRDLEQDSGPDISGLERDVDDLRRVIRPAVLDEREVFTRSGPGHALGHVPTPGPAQAVNRRTLHEDGNWRLPLNGVARYVPLGTGSGQGTATTDQGAAAPAVGGTPVLNVLGSLAVTGGLQADSLFTRLIHSVPNAIRVWNSTNVAVAAAGTVQTFNTLIFNSGTALTHSTSSNTSRINFVQGGIYLVGGAMRYAADTTGTFRAVRLIYNGTSTNHIVQVTEHAGVNQVADIGLVSLYMAAANDYFEMFCTHDASGNVNSSTVGTSTTPLAPQMWAMKVV